MNKFKCEYYSIVTGLKEVALMNSKDDYFNIIFYNNVDFDMDIMIFEKRPNWELAYHILKGEQLFRDFSDEREKMLSQKERCINQEDNIKSMLEFIDKDISPSRLENGGILQVMIDGFFFGEDVSKHKLEIIKGVNKNGKC